MMNFPELTSLVQTEALLSNVELPTGIAASPLGVFLLHGDVRLLRAATEQIHGTTY